MSSASVIQRHNETVLADLEKGDMVEFDRGIYSHWAIYIGEGKLIHLAGDENDGLNANVNSGSIFTICGRRFGKAFVRVENFWNVTLGCKANKNNSKDNRMNPADRDDIIEQAISMLGEIGYNVLWCNCEHFASYCRYGKQKSEQVEKFLTWAAVGAAAATLFGIAFASSRKDKKKDEPQPY